MFITRGYLFELIQIALIVLVFVPFASCSFAAEPSRVLIKNVNVFDGKTNRLRNGLHVLVEGEIIASISSAALRVPRSRRNIMNR